MNVLIDTNVILDAMTTREPFSQAAQTIFLLAADDAFIGFITASSATDIYYLIPQIWKDKYKKERPFMAVMTCNYFSFVMKHNVTVNVFVPTPEGNEQIVNEETKKQYRYQEGLPVVYLLHGAYGNYSSWLRFSNVERYAQKHCCALVMASADNNFYQDMVHGPAYHTFLQELPEFVKSLFPVSKKREDTFVAGFSMGGYGAWYLALSSPDQYAKAASLSGALDIAGAYADGVDHKIDSPFPWGDIFEHPDSLAGSNADLFKLYDDCVRAGTVPKLYQACGKDDFLYTMNLSVKKIMEQKDADLVFEEGEGAHTWDFWDTYIQHALDWMFQA